MNLTGDIRRAIVTLYSLKKILETAGGAEDAITSIQRTIAELEKLVPREFQPQCYGE